VGISETLCPHADSLLGTVDEYLSVRLMRLKLDYLVGTHHPSFPDKIHEKFVADLLGLVYLVIRLGHPHNQQRYLDARVWRSQMEEDLSDHGERSCRTAACSLLMLREQRNPPIVACVPLEILARVYHWDWWVIGHNLERECHRVIPSTWRNRMEMVVPQSRNEHFYRLGIDYILDLDLHISHSDLTGVGVVCRIVDVSYRPRDEQDE
jgi:hypothetical protein